MRSVVRGSPGLSPCRSKHFQWHHRPPIVLPVPCLSSPQPATRATQCTRRFPAACLSSLAHAVPSAWNVTHSSSARKIPAHPLKASRHHLLSEAVPTRTWQRGCVRYSPLCTQPPLTTWAPGEQGLSHPCALQITVDWLSDEEMWSPGCLVRGSDQKNKCFSKVF